MSILSERTDRNALRSVAKTLRFFDELTLCQMTLEDDADVKQAQRLLSGVLENAGYKAVYVRRKGTRLVKTQEI